MNLGPDAVITITGIVLVFAILVLLMLIIMLEGKIFDLWWRKAFPAMWLPQLWLPSMPWAMASTP